MDVSVIFQFLKDLAANNNREWFQGHKDEYLKMATRAKQELITHFYDHEYGGVFWSVCEDGSPLDTKKQIYA